MDDNSHKPCGWGHHKRRKKNARGRFDRQKNDECRRQQANKENISVLPLPKSTDISPDSSLLLPKHWQKLSDTQYCKVEVGLQWMVRASTHYAANHVSCWDQCFAHWSLVKVTRVPATRQLAAILGTEILLLLSRMRDWKVFIVLSKSQTRKWSDWKQELTNLLQTSLCDFKIMMLPIYHISSQKWAQLWKTDSHSLSLSSMHWMSLTLEEWADD